MTDTPPPGHDPLPTDPTSATPVTPASQPAASTTPATTAAPGAKTTATTPPSGSTPDPADVEKNKVVAAVGYLGILFLVPMLAAPASPFARYHANQGMVLCISAFIAWIGVVICDIILVFIPFVGWCIALCLGFGMLACIITMVIIGILNAVNGRLKPLPVIGGMKILK
jgi:uncharacterized membrane protein